MDKQVFCYPVFPHVGNVGIEPTDYFFLGLLREPVADGQKRITAHRVGPRLGAPLRIYCVAEVAHLSEKVVATKFYHPLAFMNRFREGCIPIETVVVHLVVGISAMAVHSEIGLKGELPRQFVSAVETV